MLSPFGEIPFALINGSYVRKKKSTPPSLVSALYGADGKFADVSERFGKQLPICLPPDHTFNTLLGCDPYYGKIKTLSLRFSNGDSIAIQEDKQVPLYLSHESSLSVVTYGDLASKIYQIMNAAVISARTWRGFALPSASFGELFDTSSFRLRSGVHLYEMGTGDEKVDEKHIDDGVVSVHPGKVAIQTAYYSDAEHILLKAPSRIISPTSEAEYDQMMRILMAIVPSAKLERISNTITAMAVVHQVGLTVESLLDHVRAKINPRRTETVYVMGAEMDDKSWAEVKTAGSEYQWRRRNDYPVGESLSIDEWTVIERDLALRASMFLGSPHSELSLLIVLGRDYTGMLSNFYHTPGKSGVLTSIRELLFSGGAPLYKSNR